MNRLNKIREALTKKLMIRFRRGSEPGSVEGYVLDIGPKFFLMAVFGDGFRFDGFGCYRIRDVKSLEVPARFSFVFAEVLKKRGERIPRKPKLSMASVEEILLGANRAFSLVTIHRERVDPDVCHIGKVVNLRRGRVWLLEIGPDAKWEESLTENRQSEITLIEFGGDYEEGMALIGGDAPKLALALEAT